MGPNHDPRQPSVTLVSCQELLHCDGATAQISWWSVPDPTGQPRGYGPGGGKGLGPRGQPQGGREGARTDLHVSVRFFHTLPLRAYRRRRLTSPAAPSTSGSEQRGLCIVATVTGSAGGCGRWGISSRRELASSMGKLSLQELQTLAHKGPTACTGSWAV